MKKILLICAFVAMMASILYSAETPDPYTELYILGVSSSVTLDPILAGNINNTLLATFASSDRFNSTSLSTLSMDEKTGREFAAALLRLHQGQQREAPFRYDGGQISSTLMQKISESYGVIIPRIKHIQLEQGASPSISLSLSLEILNPGSGALSAFAHMETTQESQELMILYADTARHLGAQLSEVLKDYAVFSVETEVSHFEKPYVYFLNREPLTPVSGMEYAIYKVKRFPDGYVDEEHIGYLRIIGAENRYWKARLIYGMPPETGDYVRFANFFGVQAGLSYSFYPGLWPEERHQGAGSLIESISMFHGPSLNLSAEINYHMRVVVETSWLIPQPSRKTRIWQTGAGLSWDVYPFPDWQAGIVLLASLRHLKESIDTGESRISATKFSPGVHLGAYVQRMLQRNVLLHLHAGIAVFAPVQSGAWKYKPLPEPVAASNTTLSHSGFFAGIAFSLRM